ncbi:LysM peptidoglycan-binding domain-containing protein [Desulfovibrio sp. OttesenSCG-928-C06]|nr:LysM peptidoglycan-binding domain-containing protein [Desulfovibrio sp. OttesenSCG-928-C06]
MHKSRTSHNLALLFLACGVLLFSAGCAQKVRTNVSGTSDVSFSVSEGADNEFEPEELVEIPELPSDDGVPLSLPERIALHSTGELDMHLTPEQKKQVELHFKYYLHKNRAGFERYLQRAEGYLPYVRQVFREMGVPEEVAGLAIVESGFNPNAVSRAGATGMWQFMRYTGQRYGLAQNYWLDERRDPFKSTVAAANYLLQLHEYFGDWHLAIAAYNGGEGKISRAMQRTGAEDFFELCRLNNSINERKMRLKPETQQYVPRFLAVTKIMRNLELLGFDAPDPAKGYQVTAVKVGPGADLGALARNAGVRGEFFRTLNPAYRRSISPVSGNSTAYIPVDNAAKAVAWLARPESRSFAGWQQYKVRKGDSLYAISSRYGVTVATLRQANNLKGNTLRQGAMLMVPGGKGAAPAAKSATSGNKAQGKQTASKNVSGGSKSASKSGNPIHTVRRGENLYQIAQSYGVSLSSLQAANNMSASDSFVLAGQKLVIPAGKSSAQASKNKTVYVVQKGDTLYSLAQKNKISLDELVRVNGLKRNKPLMPGQQLLIP